MSAILPLSEIGLADTPRAGRKAAVLGELRKAGFPVPDGFVVPVGAVPHSGDDGPPALSAELYAELATALTALGGDAVAVRSSGVAEDSADRSFAGQYESVLGVRGADALAEAVRTCLASARSDRVTRYAAGDAGDVAVLVQRMVPAEAAGVAFSADPVTGERDVTLVSAVPGLGDRLMAGEATPDEWRVHAGVAELRSGHADAVGAGTVRTVAGLANRAAEYFGAPQDVEWAVADGTVWLVQARPITALPRPPAEPVPIPVEVPPGFWTRAPGTERQWTPMQRSLYLPVLRDSLVHMFDYGFGGQPEVREIGGWPYVRMDTAPAEDPVERAERIGARVSAGEPLALARRWHDELRPATAARLAELRGTDVSALDDDAFAEHVRAVASEFRAFHDLYFRITSASTAVLGMLGTVCRDLLGWTPEQTLRLRQGLTGDHMPAMVALGDIARAARTDPELRAALDAGRADDPRVTAWIAAYGHRTAGFDLTGPTFAEQPRLVVSLIRAQLDAPFDLAASAEALRRTHESALAEAERTLAGATDADRARFRDALTAFGATTAIRDEKVYYAVSFWALARYATIELGRRLAGRGLVEDPDDAFFLEVDEALAALADGAPRIGLVRERRGQDAWATAHPGPPAYGTPPAYRLPLTEEQFRSLSPSAAAAVDAWLWTASLWGGGAPSPPGDPAGVRGMPASPGRYTGPARVVTAIAEFGKVRPGDVLVCPETTAQWAVLFPGIGAVVTDRGGLLSHPAIIAREYGVPAVVSTGNATAALHDGELVEVDGAAGTVRIVS